jgi:hypothetical protein
MPYEGWKATARINMPVREYNRLFSGSGRCEAMAEAVVDWNFVDDDGDPIPVTPEGMEMLGFDLMRMLLQKIDEAVAAPLALEN